MAVNPSANKVADEHFFARVHDVVPPADRALLITCPAVSDQVVRDCAEAGMRRAAGRVKADSSSSHESKKGFFKLQDLFTRRLP